MNDLMNAHFVPLQRLMTPVSHVENYSSLIVVFKKKKKKRPVHVSCQWSATTWVCCSQFTSTVSGKVSHDHFSSVLNFLVDPEIFFFEMTEQGFTWCWVTV